MKHKIVSADEAVAIVGDTDTVATSGFVGIGTPDELLAALARRYEAEGHPRELSLVFAAGQGDGHERGLNRLGRDGLLKRVIGGHWGLIPKVAELALSERIEAYNLPQGVISHLYRDIAAGKPGTLSKVGINTFVDPTHEGGRLNALTTRDIVHRQEIGGEPWLFYETFPITVAFLRGTTADPDGNVTMEREALTLDNLATAMAARNCNGVVIVQVERIAKRGTLHPRQVKIPGVLVDCVVVAEPENHHQTYATPYSPGFAHEIAEPLDDAEPMPLNARKLVARRCAFELPPNGVVNLGIGMPEGVARVANEERVLDHITLTAEPGVVGGLPASGLDFGAARNTDALIEQNQQFDFYDGGGLDLACLGMAQADARGNVNVSRFGGKLAGAGGFINISQNARRLIFAGTFTAGGLEVAVENGELRIVNEGKARKFNRSVEQITFSGDHAVNQGQPVRYVTERCVFALTPEGMELLEVAPGIEIERDILAKMDFEPIVREPATMEARLFADDRMGLKDVLLSLKLAERISYEAERNLLFLNFEGMQVRSEQDVAEIRDAVAARCQKIGKRVWVIVNYDNFQIPPDLLDAYADMVRHMEENYYLGVSRYTTSAFLRLKLGGALTRHVAPHIFETPEEARKHLGEDGATS